MASHLRSSIPGFSMLTSPTVACGSIYQILKNGPSSPACKVRKPPSARHQSRSCWSSYSQCSLLRWTSLGEPFFSLEFERGCFFIFSSPLKLKRDCRPWSPRSKWFALRNSEAAASWLVLYTHQLSLTFSFSTFLPGFSMCGVMVDFWACWWISVLVVWLVDLRVRLYFNTLKPALTIKGRTWVLISDYYSTATAVFQINEGMNYIKKYPCFWVIGWFNNLSN